MLSTLKKKRSKNSYGSNPTEFASSTHNPKKNHRNIKSTNQKENFPKKTMFRTLKVQRSQKFVWGLPDKINPGSLKNNRKKSVKRVKKNPKFLSK
jgi:hypothetical protein